MKKLTILFLLTFSVSAYSQVFIAGVNGAFNTTWLFNKFETTPTMDRESELTFGSFFGADFKFYANSNSFYSSTFFAIAFNPSIHSINQKYKGNIVDTANANKSYPYKMEYNLKSIELPLMLHVEGEAGLYAEIGVSYGLIQSAKASFSTEDTSFSSVTDLDVKSNFASSNLSGIFGFGVCSEIADNVILTTGFRFTYGLANLNSSDANTAGVPSTRTGTGGFVLGLAYKFDSYHSRN